MSPTPASTPPHRPRRLRKLLLALVATVLVICIGVFAYCWRMALTAVAPAPSHVGVPPADLPIETISFASESGATIAGWYLPADNPRGIIVLAHPIRGSRASMLERARLFRSAGYSTLLVDLQAHGESTGDTITMGHLERHDLHAAVDYAKTRAPGLPIAVDGWSLGGAAALMASPLGIDALILE